MMDLRNSRSFFTVHCSLFIAHRSLFTVLYSLPFVLCSVFFSCQSAPKNPDPFTVQVSRIPLEPGAQVYALIDTNACRAILDELSLPGISGKQKKLILDKTDSAAVALYREDNERTFQLAAWGDITAAQGDLAFGMSADWKKMKCAAVHRGRQRRIPYWYSQSNNMTVALGMRQAFVSQSRRAAAQPPCTHSAGTELPAGFGEFSRGAVLSCWISDLGSLINKVFRDLNIEINFPAEYAFLSLCKAAAAGSDSPEIFEAQLRIETPSATQARALIRIITLARTRSNNFSNTGTLQPVLEFFLANELSQDGKYICINTGRIDPDGISLLVHAISVYSKNSKQSIQTNI